jgi:hypothetical protein
MAQTFAGVGREPLDGLRRPWPPRHRSRRQLDASTPKAFLVVACELLRLPRAAAQDTWAAIATAGYSETQAMVSLLRYWATVAESLREAGQRGLTPARLVHCCELAVIAGTLSPQEATCVEGAILARMDKDGQWCT